MTGATRYAVSRFQGNRWALVLSVPAPPALAAQGPPGQVNWKVEAFSASNVLLAVGQASAR